MHLHAKSTALVLIDLQKGVLATPVVPYSGATNLARSTKLAAGFRATGSPVVWVRVFFASNVADAPRAQVDRPTDHNVLPSGWDEFPHPLDPADVMVTKRQGAPSTAPISICSYGAAACAPLC
jgi:nicotinamidase-related amidase